MTNVQAFELINVGPGLTGPRLIGATALASWAVGGVPVYLAVAWQRSRAEGRLELVAMLVTALLALGLAHALATLWPRPGPPALHLGHQYLAMPGAAVLPSDPVTLFWSLGGAALASRRHALAGFPLLALGLGAGWCRVYLGVLFPLDLLLAMPVALCGVLAAWALRRTVRRVGAPALRAYDRFECWLLLALHRRPAARD